MKKITFGLSTTSALLSKVIKSVQGIEFSHAYIEFDDEFYDERLIFEAKGLSSYIINKNHFKSKTIYSFEFIVTEQLYFEIMKYIYQEIGTPYAWKELLGFGVVKVCRLFGIKIKNPWPQKGKVCSESCGDILVRFFGVTPDVRRDDMDLVWLFDKLIHHPYFNNKGKDVWPFTHQS